MAAFVARVPATNVMMGTLYPRASRRRFLPSMISGSSPAQLGNCCGHVVNVSYKCEQVQPSRDEANKRQQLDAARVAGFSHSRSNLGGAQLMRQQADLWR